ncbi:MAG: 6-bladed beta-propeller [Candidatus Aminicenantes bacterium]|nr:6-bladed beta-propeller [Candidatus Aminicenantes bacterium]
MKKNIAASVSVIFFLFLFFGANPAQAEVEHKILFKKVLEFSDDSEDFFFKYPDNPYNRQMQVDCKGNIYILDANRILKFDSSGRFIKNLMSHGQGPGEVTRLRNFILRNDKIYIYNHYPDKIIIKDKKGALVKEFRTTESLDKFFAVYAKNYYSFNEELLDLTINYAKIIDVDWYLIRVSSKGKIETVKDCKLPIKSFIVKKGRNISEIRIAKILVAQLKDKTFFVTHSTEYEVKLLDIKKKKVVKTFKRDYQRQEPPPEVAKKLNIQAFGFLGKVYRRPPQKYLNDIQQLLVHGDNLWVATSTVDEKKGVLIDIFNKDCEFSGSFYLKLSDRLGYLDYFSFHAYIFDSFLYTIESDKDDNPRVVKYEIITAE